MARASFEELLLDYHDYLRLRDHTCWDKDSAEALYVRKLGVSSASIANWETKGGPLKLQAASLACLQILARESAPDA